MKKSFDCGHFGKGRFCHRCVQDALSKSQAALAGSAKKQASAQQKAEARASRIAACESDRIDLSALDHMPALLCKARKIIEEVMLCGDHARLGGKRLASTGNEAVSVPVGDSYRLIFTGRPLRPLELLTHETYSGKYVD